MKHLWKIFLAMAVMLALVVEPATASASDPDGALTLDNKDPSTWARISDSAEGALSFYTSGPTFAFGFAAGGLEPSVEYSLIYYANPWPGNNPGKLIGTGTSDSSGGLTISGSPDLGMSLPTAPDSNMVVDHCGIPDDYGICYGAKIWLVPSECYDEVLNRIKDSGWQPTRFLFETDLINYTDTDDGYSGGSVGLAATITEPEATMGLNVVPVSNPIVFGGANIGDCSDEFAVILENTGNVPIKVEALASAGFFTDCLHVDGTLVGDWESTTIDAGDSLTVYIKICIYTTTYSGSQTGSVTFLAFYSP